jgi:AraC family transcriptional regulator
MSPVNKALWYIESHLSDDMTLGDVAAAGGVSRFHMCRAFGEATGRSVLRYLRGRRLSAAARMLTDGATDILSVALEAGYGSHEAFTRAFRDEFGWTPEQVRAERCLDKLKLVEAVTMDEELTTLEPPRFEDGRVLLIAGLRTHYTSETVGGIPSQWHRFQPFLETVPGRFGRVAFGVSLNCDDTGGFDYVCGVEVTDFAGLPSDLDRLRIPAHRYAVFRHVDHISTIRRTMSTIWNRWLPESGYEAADAPNLERYDESFDPDTGTGGLEIWIPVAASP